MDRVDESCKMGRGDRVCKQFMATFKLHRNSFRLAMSIFFQLVFFFFDHRFSLILSDSRLNCTFLSENDICRSKCKRCAIPNLRGISVQLIPWQLSLFARKRSKQNSAQMWKFKLFLRNKNYFPIALDTLFQTQLNACTTYSLYNSWQI